MIFVGMDVHVRNSYLSVSDKSGRRLKRGRVGNTLAEIAEFLGPFETQPMRVSLENTTNARAIHTLLCEYGTQAGIDLTAQVLDARKLRVIAESVSKCDRLDADILSELTGSKAWIRFLIIVRTFTRSARARRCSRSAKTSSSGR